MEAGSFQIRKPLNKVCMRLTLKRPLFVKSKKISERVDSITNKITDKLRVSYKNQTCQNL